MSETRTAIAQAQAIIDSLLQSAGDFAGLPDSHLLELVWADEPTFDPDEPTRYITLGELRRAADALAKVSGDQP